MIPIPSTTSLLNVARTVLGKAEGVYNPDLHQIRIFASTHGNTPILEGKLPDSIDLSMGASYETVFSDNQIIEGIIKFTRVIGNKTSTSTSSILNSRVWASTDPITLSLDLKLSAKADAQKEIIQPINKVLQLLVPNNDAGGELAVIPGPRFNIKQSSKGSVTGTIIRVEVGSFFTLDNCILTSVTPSINTGVLDSKGTPMNASINITIESYFPQYTKDIDSLFVSQTGEAASSKKSGLLNKIHKLF